MGAGRRHAAQDQRRNAARVVLFLIGASMADALQSVARQQLPEALRLRLEIEAAIIGYWHNVDHHWGRDAHLFYTDDAVFSTSERARTGRAAIAQFYSGRVDRGPRVARHVITNLYVTSQGSDGAAAESILLLHAADGEPVLPSAPPIMIADVRESFRRGADGQWLCASRAIVALFKGGVPTTS
jgi:ketosteroid isomerase-like protein